MLDLTSIDTLIETIQTQPRNTVLNTSFHFSARIAPETRYLARFGVIGVVAVSYYTSGDQLALRVVPGQPLAKWPVVHASHIGEGSRTISSRLSRMMAAILQIDTPLEHQQALKVYTESVLTHSDWLGDTDGITQAFIDQSRDENADMFSPLPHLPFSSADPDSVLALFDAVYEQAVADPSNLAERWRTVIQMDASFSPAQALYFRALLTGDDDSAIRQSAWNVWMLNHALDNVYMVEPMRNVQFGWPDENPVLIAAQTLLERGLPPTAESQSEIWTPVIETFVADEDAYDGTAHLEAARQLHAQKDYERAFIASQNAVFWRNFAQETAYPEALAFALTIARDWQQPELIRALELAQAQEAPAKTETPAQSEIVLPREVEWSPQAKLFLEKLASGEKAYVSGDWILIHRYQRWHWMSQSYRGQVKTIATMAILTPQKLSNVIPMPEDFSKTIVPVADLPDDLQQELRFKLLPEIDDYHYLMDNKHISITGGATTEDTTNPQLERDQQRELTRRILMAQGGGWFNVWSTWQEIEQALKERS